jgi:hypothetical protein
MASQKNVVTEVVGYGKMHIYQKLGQDYFFAIDLAQTMIYYFKF